MWILHGSGGGLTMLGYKRYSLKSLPSILLPYFSLSSPPSSPSTAFTLLPNETYPIYRNLYRRMEGTPPPRFNGRDSPSLCRGMSTAVARSMRSKVERRMRRESGRTLKEIRRARILKKKLMTNEERLLYNMRRAKKKISLLLQKLKKYELPELPEPLHDPEILTPEQLQSYKKIGFKNKNYVPVGVRGVFGGVVLNMHLHWKFHETVQVCCDNFPREKIREMASMLARLSGGIVINIHDVKTIIMFRGRNYRQPMVMTPINTLTKRKALFKARFEQALESQKLNVKKIEQQLRQIGVNPDDPMAMASIQRVASTFFSAIDKNRGSPYVFRGDEKLSLPEPEAGPAEPEAGPAEPCPESDQEELDRFIAEIEETADKECAVEDAAEMEEYGRIRYLNRPDYGWSPRRYGMPSDDDRGGGGDSGSDYGGPGRRGWGGERRRVESEEDSDEGGAESKKDSEARGYDGRLRRPLLRRTAGERRIPESDGDSYPGAEPRWRVAAAERRISESDKGSDSMYGSTAGDRRTDGGPRRSPGGMTAGDRRISESEEDSDSDTDEDSDSLYGSTAGDRRTDDRPRRRRPGVMTAGDRRIPKSEEDSDSMYGSTAGERRRPGGMTAGDRRIPESEEESESGGGDDGAGPPWRRDGRSGGGVAAWEPEEEGEDDETYRMVDADYDGWGGDDFRERSVEIERENPKSSDEDIKSE